MNAKLVKIVLSLFIILFTNSPTVYSLSVETHEVINETVAKGAMNGFSLDSYLRNNLGVSEGVNEFFNNKKVFDWFKLGGEYEDVPTWYLPYIRAANHFHNPLTEEGFSGFVFGLLLKGDSSIIWAQKPKGTQTPGGYYSWFDVRGYYYNALTSQDKTTMYINFAETFRGLGQLLHLIQDLSVPAHTRNDFHPTGGYESWVKRERRKADIAAYSPFFFNQAAIGQPSRFSLAPVPIANLFDTNQYNGVNPDLAVGNTIGLSEYAQANFLSEGLISTTVQDFPYPKFDTASIIERNFTNTFWNTTYPREYYLKNCCGETKNNQGYLLSAVDYLDYYRQQYPLLSFALPKIPVLDNNVYRDYASLLLPRAVGYSAGLLNYFFRGTLEITAPDSYVYSIIDGSETPYIDTYGNRHQQFTSIKAKIRNTTPNEEMQNGIIQAVARYKKRTDYQPDLSTDPPTAESREPEFSYSVSAPITITSLNSATPEEFTFDFSNSPIPAGITDLYLHVIFKGTLGNEIDTAIAVGMKDINEPMHISVWNATDYFYLDGVLRTAEEIRIDPLLFSRVDHNGDGISDEFIDPYDVTTNLAFTPTTDIPTMYNVIYVPLPPGRYGRVIILTDATSFYMHVHRESIDPVDSLDTYFLFSGVINQETDGTFNNTQVYTFRGIIQHEWSAFARYYPDYTGISTAPWPVPTITDPYPATTINP